MTADQIAALIAYDLSDRGLTVEQREVVAEAFAARLYGRKAESMRRFISKCKREGERPR